MKSFICSFLAVVMLSTVGMTTFAQEKITPNQNNIGQLTPNDLPNPSEAVKATYIDESGNEFDVDVTSATITKVTTNARSGEEIYLLALSAQSPKSKTGHDSVVTAKLNVYFTYSEVSVLGKRAKRLLRATGNWKLASGYTQKDVGSTSVYFNPGGRVIFSSLNFDVDNPKSNKESQTPSCSSTISYRSRSGAAMETFKLSVDI